MTDSAQASAKKLSNRQGACLRYVTSTPNQPVDTSRLISYIEWSVLPHSYLEAKATLEALRTAKLVKKQGSRGFTPTDLGDKVIAYANKKGLYRVALVNQPSSRRNF
jgi:hypothetical protein